MARPRWLFGFPSRARGDIDADIRDEIAFHLEARVQELVDRGWTREAAAREAARQFGSPAETAAYCRNLDIHTERHVRLSRFVDEFRQDLSYTIRTFVAQPAFTAVALLTIALGIGATTLVFSVVYRSLLAPLPYGDADRLMIVRASIPDYDDLRASTDIFEDSGIYASNQYLLDEEQTLGGVVGPGVFSTLGVKPILGRTIETSDGPAPVAVLSYSLWQRKYGADPGVIGRTIQLYDTGYTVVGVMPLGFQFPARTFQLWVNFESAITQVPQQRTNRALRIWQVVGRLKPSVTQAQAQSQLTALAERLAQTYPATNTQVGLTLVALRERLVGNSRAALLMALGAVGCLLLIACANVASLNLTRLTARTQELAVRAALGAGRWRIARQLATESVLTAACGGAIGVLGAWWGLSALPALIGNRVPRVDEVALSLPVLAVSIAAIVLGGLFVAALPIVHLSLAQIEPMLRAGGRHGGEIRFGVRLRSALVVAQIGLTVVVLAGSLVLTRSFLRLVTVDTGFSPDRLLAFNVALITQRTSAGRIETAARVLESIAAIPGVTAAGGATGLAPITAQRGTSFEVDGGADATADDRRGYFIAASPDYFRTLGTRIVAGREFAATDREGAPPVAIVSRTLARRFFGDADPIGRRLRLVNPEYSNDWRTIVGVVADVRYQGLDNDGPRVVYTPFAQTPFPWIYVHVRTEGDPMAALGSIRSAVKGVDARLGVANPQPMTALMSESSADPRFRTTLISLFAIAAMVLAAIGLHGVIAFGVARRVREIAIRLALGATTGSVRWRVISQALLLVSGGLAVGLVGAYTLGGVLEGMLYETSPADPVALAAVAILLLLTAIVASALPARRATRVQPVDALRES
jgi:putative ABC transport system permease protein